MDDIAVLERLVPAGNVIDLLAREYDRRGDYANFEECRRVALETLVTRLKGGYLNAWSTTSEIDSTADTGSASVDQICSTWDFHRHSGFPAKVPQEFWMHFHYAGEARRSFDPIAGDFCFEYMDEMFASRDGTAFAVYFDPRGLPPCSVPSWHAGEEPSSVKTVTVTPASQSNKGRPPANWWPAFAEELAIYIHDNGPPETQEALINGVLTSMAAQGKAEPSRSQIQPVIRAFFDRLGRAGK